MGERSSGKIFSAYHQGGRIESEESMTSKKKEGDPTSQKTNVRQRACAQEGEEFSLLGMKKEEKQEWGTGSNPEGAKGRGHRGYQKVKEHGLSRAKRKTRKQQTGSVRDEQAKAAKEIIDY